MKTSQPGQDVSKSHNQPMILSIQSQLLNIWQPAPNQISITFQELSKNLKHQILNHQLDKINYKTVISSLKGQNPNILSAKLQKNSDQLHILTIKVNYEFLPEIEQQFIFQKLELSEQEKKTSSITFMRSHLQNIKQQALELSTTQVLVSEIKDKNFQETIKVPFPKTLVSWTIHLQSFAGKLKCQLEMYDSKMRVRTSTKVIPQEGIQVHGGGNQGIVQLRFLIQQSEKFDQFILNISSKCKGKSIIALQRL